jgi:hypothetical protein
VSSWSGIGSGGACSPVEGIQVKCKEELVDLEERGKFNEIFVEHLLYKVISG